MITQRPLSELPPGLSSWFEPSNPSVPPIVSQQEVAHAKTAEATLPGASTLLFSIERPDMVPIQDLEPGLVARGLRRAIEFGRSLMEKTKERVAKIGSASLADLVEYKPVYIAKTA